MAFSDNYYYDIVLLWVEQYKKESEPHLKELLLRNILSRAYYTMLLHCREQHTHDTRLTYDIMQGAHENIIELVTKQSIKSTLFTYKFARRRADYSITSLTIPVANIRLGNQSHPFNLQNIDTIKAYMDAVLAYK